MPILGAMNAVLVWVLIAAAVITSAIALVALAAVLFGACATSSGRRRTVNIDIEVPEGLNPSLTALGWLVGRWEGTGNGTDHEGADFEFEQRIEFSHNGGDYLFYKCRRPSCSARTARTRPRSAWRPALAPQGRRVARGDATNADGWTELLVGKIQVTRIDLLSDAVVRAESASRSLHPRASGSTARWRAT